MSAKIAAFVRAFPQLHKNAAGRPAAESSGRMRVSKRGHVPNAR